MKIRNLLPGILHVPAAKLVLQGREVKEVPEITPAIQKLIDAKRIAVVKDGEAVQAPAPKLPKPHADYEKMYEAEAIDFVGDETDPKVIQSILQTEKRGSVINALKERLKEIGDARK